MADDKTMMPKKAAKKPKSSVKTKTVKKIAKKKKKSKR
jgi:hypothetical protein